jgi:eukaryotic-like serine/threonine-protein kinase
MTLPAGARLGPYEVLVHVGSGGMGDVYRARDTRLDRIVAIKVLPPHVLDDPGSRARFEREARVASSLDHPNICVLHDVGREGAVAYLVMQYLVGETLSQRLARGPLPIGEAVGLAADLAGALDAAHRAGILHRDIKPGNVMLVKDPGRDASAKLLDFGLAKTISAGAVPARDSRHRDDAAYRTRLSRCS